MAVQNTQNIGELNEPVVFAAPAFAALSALYLDATAVCISIHASMRLRALHIAANTLTVTFLLSCSLRCLDRCIQSI